jgi:hypothetical protein
MVGCKENGPQRPVFPNDVVETRRSERPSQWHAQKPCKSSTCKSSTHVQSARIGSPCWTTTWITNTVSVCMASADCPAPRSVGVACNEGHFSPRRRLRNCRCQQSRERWWALPAVVGANQTSVLGVSYLAVRPSNWLSLDDPQLSTAPADSTPQSRLSTC